jgi:DNA-directed RNA polymerase specialized sigma24 family protein
MSHRPVYEVRAIREGDWWSLVADLGSREVASQTKRLANAEEMIREAIALALDVEDDSFEVNIDPILPNELQTIAGSAMDLRSQWEELGQELSKATSEAITKLRARGYSVRDIAELVGVTPGRVSQIEHERPRDAPPPSKQPA